MRANRGKIEVLELLLARPLFHRRYPQDRRDRHGHLLDLDERGLQRLSQLLSPALVVERALELGAGDRERRAQIVGDVVARTLEVVEQAGDLVEHQVHGARDLADVILSGERQAQIEIAVHDPDNGVVNALESLRGAICKPSADRQDQQNRRKERDRQCAQQGLLEVVVLPQAAPQQKNASVRAATCDENGWVLIAVWIGEDVFIDEVRFRVDRDSRQEGHVSENQLAFRVDQRDKIQAPDIPRQAQLQRPAQVSLALVDALGRLVDKNCADLLHVCAGDLQIDEREGCGRRDRDRQGEAQREAKRPRLEDLKRPHSV